MGRTIIAAVVADAPEHHTQYSVETRDDFTMKNRQPLLGSFADVWESRQTSEIIMDEFKKEDEQESSVATMTPRASSEGHASRIVAHNPYSLSEPVINLFTCLCHECQTPQASRVHSQEYTPEVSCNSGLALYSRPDVPSVFMPPPPPRPDTGDIISYGGAGNGELIFTQLMYRWYYKCCDVQLYFVDEENVCPAPKPEQYDTASWSQLVNDWWVATFSGMQRKPTTSHNGVW